MGLCVHFEPFDVAAVVARKFEQVPRPAIPVMCRKDTMP